MMGETTDVSESTSTPSQCSTQCAPPPPPLPPPPVLPQLGSVGKAPKITPTELQLPAPEEEFRQLCTNLRTRLYTQEPGVFLCRYQYVTPVIQDGPTCGLVAVCMVSPLVGGEPLDVNNVFRTAQQRGVSQQGEMFSASAMCQLVKELCHVDAEISIGYHDNQVNIISSLLKGAPVLVPYDKDSNTEPGLKHGHKAHWALLSGLVIIRKELPDILRSCCRQDENVGYIYHTDTVLTDAQLASLAPITAKDVYVCAKQGKSRRTALWCLDSLLQSNANLTELGPNIVQNLEHFTVPPEGIQGGLCHQVVLLQCKK